MLIGITGPTASGKSSLAVSIALNIGNAEIISADSRQIYKGMDKGTGKITKKEMREVPHHLLDIIDLKKEFTVTEYKREAENKISLIHKKGGVPIICGGTGFYIKAVVEGVALPQVPPNKDFRNHLQKNTKEELFSMLLKQDRRRAEEIEGMNKRKLIRALEIVKATGKPVPKTKKETPNYPVLILGIDTPSHILEERIEKRVDEMISKGLKKEAKEIFKKNGKLAKETIGYSEWQKYFNKEESLEEVRESIINNTKKYAKRQMRWFRKEKYIVWIKNEEEALKKVMSFLKKA